MIAKYKPATDEQRIRISLVPWPAYVAFCDALGEHSVRITFDQGELEFISLSRKHEMEKSRL